jgi:hypothetical protein
MGEIARADQGDREQASHEGDRAGDDQEVVEAGRERRVGGGDESGPIGSGRGRQHQPEPSLLNLPGDAVDMAGQRRRARQPAPQAVAQREVKIGVLLSWRG